MSDRVFCTATFEPEAVYGRPVVPPGSLRALTLHLNFDIVDHLAPREPERRFRAFLLALPSATFYAYAFNGAGDLDIVSSGDLSITAFASPSNKRVKEIMRWLALQVGGPSIDGGRWTGRDPTVGSTYTAENLDASQALSSAALWNAPLPQEAGLVRYIELKAASAGFSFEGLVVLPFFNSVAAPPTISKTSVAVLGEGELDVTYDAGLPSGTMIACRTRPTLRLKTDPTSLVNEQLGFLHINEEAPDIHHTLLQVRNQSGSLFWSLPPLLSLEWTEASDERWAKRLVWRAVNGLGTLLDPLMLSLMMPDSKSEGPLVSALIGEILQKVPDGAPGKIMDFVRTRATALLHVSEHETADERRAIADRFRALFKPETANQALLPALLDLYVEPGPAGVEFDDISDELRRRFADEIGGPAGLERQLRAELGNLSAGLQSEAGLETLLRALFAEADITPEALHVDSAVGRIEDWRAAFEAFDSFLDTSMNTLEAARHAQAALFEAAFVREAKSKAEALIPPALQWDHKLLLEAISEADWFAQRLHGGSMGALGSIAKVCPTFALLALDSTDLSSIESILKGLYENALTSMLTVGKPSRFNPDHAPRPLPIQISVDSDTTDLDNFTERYNGVSVLIKRSDIDWAYANLAVIDVVDSSNPVRDLTIRPLQSVDVDGQRQLFLEFNGMPFASNALTEFAPTQDEAAFASRPFYTADAPDSAQLGAKTKLPALAYGMKYSVASHVLSASGSLPSLLQASPAVPWRPSDTINLTSLPGGYVHEQSYLRTTAVGRIVINENTQGAAPRIGTNIDGVYPLFGDFPRVGVASTKGLKASLDVLRNADGTGAFTLPVEGKRALLEISDLMWWGGEGRLTVELFVQPNPKPEDKAACKWIFPIVGAFDDERVSISIIGEATQWAVSATGPHGTVIVGDPHFIPAPNGLDDAACWIRLSVKATSRTKSVSLSLRDLSLGFRSDHAGSQRQKDNLVLLAPGEDRGLKKWLPKYEKDVTAEIVFPKVTHDDFDRWYNNPSARPSGADDETLKKARQGLLAVSLARTFDDRLSKLIDALPDPAIDKIILELTPLDGLTNAPSEMVKDEHYLAFSHVLDLSAIYERPLPDIDDPAHFVTALANLARHHSADLIVSSEGASLAIAQEVRSPSQKAAPPRVDPEFLLKVNVPRGLVAQLTVRPLLSVAKAAVFDTRMEELACEKRTIKGVDYLVMEGASLIIESMLDVLAAPAPKSSEHWLSTLNKSTNTWADLVLDSVAVVDAGRQRRYDLATQPKKTMQTPGGWRWRQLGSIDTQTQRWRHSGRPIYSWFDPKAGRTPPVNTPSIALSHDHPGLGAFVGEAFSDRDDEDADVQTTRLNVFPEETRLQTFPWELPSATLFRHRLTVRSRYAGALLLSAVSEAPAWRLPPVDRKFETWTHVAMLADQTRLQLTRPRLRALIPLTKSIDIDPLTTVDTPPIMAVLDEAPFFHGGLADRIGAEIKTGFGYEMGANAVGLKDSRKEVGPDPRLTYSPTDVEQALALSLSSEGPVGLTFDSMSVRAPAFANTALALSPVLLSEVAAPIDLEEHFMSVALRRYLDHRWVVEQEKIPTDLSSAEAWWIELKRAQYLWCSGEQVCQISVVGNSFEVLFNPDLIYKGGQNTSGFVPVCKASKTFITGLALQYLPLEAGRASISVFGIPKPNQGLGSNLPLLLATAEWAIPEGTSILEFDGPKKAYRTSASPTTSMNWTRTGRDFELVNAFDDQDETHLSKHPVNAITIKKVDGAYRFRTKTDDKIVALEASLNTAPNPLYVHRHLAVVNSMYVQSAGRPVEVYDNAIRLLGNAIPNAQAKDSVRVVEFETPATPICWNLPNGVTGLDHFKSAHFDLYAILGAKFADDTGKAPIGLSLFFRPLASGGNKSITSLTFNLSSTPIKRGRTAPATGRFRIRLPSGNTAPLRGIVLEITGHEPNNPLDATILAKAIYGGGDTPDLNVSITTAFQFCVLDSASIDISIDSVAGLPANSEFWADMSMLTLPRSVSPDAASFTFDWFFSGNEIEANAAVSPSGLASMTEAQARIISVSSPIQVGA